MVGWRAFRLGIAHAARYWQLLALLFGANLLSALLLAALPALFLASGPGHSTALPQAVDGVDAWLVIETMMSPLANVGLEAEGADPLPAQGLQQAVLLGLLTLAALPFLAWLPAAFLNGGLLLTYVEHPQPFRWRRFLWGCWRWWGTFLLLGVLQGFAVAMILLPLAVVAAMAAVTAGRWLMWLLVVGTALVAVIGLALVEYTRIIAVKDGTRNLFHAFAGAVRFVLRRPLQVGVLYALSLLLVALLHAIYRLGLMPYLPLDWWPLVLVVQQTFVAARLASRLVRLAGGVALASPPALRASDLPERHCSVRFPRSVECRSAQSRGE